MAKKIKQHAYLFDATRCIDCRACMVACSVENNVPMNDSRIWVSGIGVHGEYPNLSSSTMPYHCMHCLEPACVSACPVHAWEKREDGPVVYTSEKCIGCRYCMNACPFGVPHFDWHKGIIEEPLIHKCDFCASRLARGLEPACVATCPTDALIYGDRDELIAKAHARIEARPDKYIDHVYGEHENGGTSYLIIADTPSENLGLPKLGTEPVTKYSELVMEGTIPFALGWTAVLSGVAGAIRLRNRLTDASEETPTDEAVTDEATSDEVVTELEKTV